MKKTGQLAGFFSRCADSADLTPVKTVVLRRNSDPFTLTTEGARQRSYRKFRRVVLLAKMRRDQMLEPAAVK